MVFRSFTQGLSRYRSSISLYVLLVVPFVVTTVGAVALVGYLSYRNGLQAAAAMKTHLVHEMNDRVAEELTNYLQVAVLINRLNVDAVEQQRIDPQNLTEIEALLFNRLQQFEHVTAVMFARPDGSFRVVERSPAPTLIGSEPATPKTVFVYRLTPEGQREQLINTVPRSATQHDRSWYQPAVEAGKLVWNPISRHGTDGALVMNAAQPGYADGTNRLLGVFGVHIQLDYFSQFLERLAIQHGVKLVILNENQEIIATSTLEPLYITGSGTGSGDRHNPPDGLLPITASHDELLRTLGEQMRHPTDAAIASHSHRHLQIRYQGTKQFVHIVPFRNRHGLNWRIVTIVPESNFTQTVARNARDAFLISLLGMGLAIAASIVIANRLTAPIARLNRASQKLAAGDLTQPLPTTSPITEIKDLSQSFNQMAEQVRHSFDRINAALATSEAKFTSIFRSNPEPMGIATFKEGRILEVNESMVEFFGYPREQLVGHTAEELKLWGDLAARQDFRQQLQQFGKVTNIETTGKTRAGELKTMLISAELKEVEGQQCIIAAIKDISDRTAAEAALQRSEASLREAQRIAQLGSWEYDVATRTFCWSEQMFHILGLASGETVPSLDEIFEYLPPEDREELREAVDRALQTGQTHKVEHRINRPDGSVRYAVSKVQAITNDQRHVSKLYGTMSDITDRKQVELALIQSELRLREISESSPAVIFIVVMKPDGALYFEHISRAAETVHELSTEDILADASLLFSCTHPDDREGYLSAVHSSRNTMQPFQHEWRMINRSGTLKWVQCTSRPVRRDNGDIAWYGVTIDITDRKQTELALQQAKEAAEAASLAKSTFLANMSHELRTPLNVILGYAQLLGYDTSLNSEYQEYLRSIQRSGNHLLDLINDVLDLSKIEAGRLTLSSHQFHLIDLLQTLCEMFRLRAETKNVELNLHLSPNLPETVCADLNKLRQVLSNLLSNAVKFTHTGAISITAQSTTQSTIQSTAQPTTQSTAQSTIQSTAQPTLLIQVCDTGVGIAPEEIDTIFEAFSQASAGKSSFEGTGLGLAISKRFVQIMGGEITVESTPGKGSCFRFWVPIQPISSDELVSTAPDRTIEGLLPGQPQYRILVVDDQSANRLLLTQLLRKIGLDVRQAASGLEAVQTWQTYRPDLIWMDLRMSGINGEEAMRQIRNLESASNPSAPPVPIIALTAQAYQQDRDRALAEGFTDFVTKPFTVADIFNKMATHLGLKYQYADTASLPVKPAKHQLIQSTELKMMSPEWLAELRSAALNCSAQEAERLINQIPPSTKA